MSDLTMFRDNTRTVSVWVSLKNAAGVPVGVDLAGCTLWFTVKYAKTWKTDPDAAALLQLSTLAGTVVIAATGSQWVPSTVYATNALAMPVVRNGLYYEAATGGTSGSSEPLWPTAIGGTVTDGSVVWVCVSQTGHATGTILPAMTKPLVIDGQFQFDWKLLDAGGVVTTLETGMFRVLADVTRAGT